MSLGRLQTRLERQCVGNAGRNFQNLAGHSDQVRRCPDHRKLKRRTAVFLAGKIDPDHRSIANRFGQRNFGDVKFGLEPVLDQVGHTRPQIGCYSTWACVLKRTLKTVSNRTLLMQLSWSSRTSDCLWKTQLHAQLHRHAMSSSIPPAQAANVNSPIICKISISPALACSHGPTDGHHVLNTCRDGRHLSTLGEASASSVASRGAFPCRQLNRITALRRCKSGATVCPSVQRIAPLFQPSMYVLRAGSGPTRQPSVGPPQRACSRAWQNTGLRDTRFQTPGAWRLSGFSHSARLAQFCEQKEER